jgi:DNA-binding Lrp family transcriptional regulator
MTKKRKYGDAWKNVTVAENEITQMDSVFSRFFETDRPQPTGEAPSTPNPPSVSSDEFPSPIESETSPEFPFTPEEIEELGLSVDSPVVQASASLFSSGRTAHPESTHVPETMVLPETIISQTTVLKPVDSASDHSPSLTIVPWTMVNEQTEPPEIDPHHPTIFQQTTVNPPKTLIPQTTVNPRPPEEEGSFGEATITPRTTFTPQRTIVRPTTVVSENPEPLSQTTVPPRTTVVPRIQVEPTAGYLQIPNAIIDGLLPQLPIHEQIVYVRLFRLSHGFRSETCKIGFDRLATLCNLSKSAVIRAVEKLEAKGIVIRLEADFGSSIKAERGNVYEVRIPDGTIVYQTTVIGRTTVSPQATVVHETPIKEKRHDSFKKNHHQSRIEMTYRELTGNEWSVSDERLLAKLPELDDDQVIDLMRAVHARSADPIGSFAYFVKAIETEQSPAKGMASRKSLRTKYEKWGREIRAAHVGDGNFKSSDLIFQLKRRCLREGIKWDDDLATEVLGL